MLTYIENILKGVKQWVEGLFESRDYVVASHINELTDKCSSGGNDNKFIHIKSYIDRRSGSTPELCIAVPAGTSLSNYSGIKHYKKSRTRSRNTSQYHTYGWHCVWNAGTKVKPLIKVQLEDISEPNFTQGGFDFYRVLFYDYTNDKYVGLIDFVNNVNTKTDYKSKDKRGRTIYIHIGTIMSKVNGICLVDNDGNIASNFATFRVVYSDEQDDWYIAPV